MDRSTTDVLEIALDAELSELFNSEGKLHEKGLARLANLDYGELADRFAEVYRECDAPVYARDEVVPRLYDSCLEYPFDSRVPPPLVSPGFGQTRAALMYAHKVEAADPLIEAFDYAALWWNAPVDFMLDPFGEVIKAVWYINKVRPLIEKGIVVFRPPGLEERRESATELIESCLTDETRRSDLSKLLGYDVGEDWSPYFSDFIHCMQQTSGSHADFWFPSRTHEQCARIFASSTAVVDRDFRC